MSYTNPNLPAEERAEHLLGLMTLEEKAGQLIQPFGWQAYEHRDGKMTLTESFKEKVAGAAWARFTGCCALTRGPV